MVSRILSLKKWAAHFTVFNHDSLNEEKVCVGAGFHVLGRIGCH